MLYEQETSLAAQVEQEFDHALAFVRTHAGHGFVQQQQSGPGRQRNTHFKLTLLTMRHAAGVVIEPVAEPYPGSDGGRFVVTPQFAACGPKKAETGAVAGLDRQCYVVEHRQPSEYAGDLVGSDQPSVHAIMHRHSGDISSLEQDHTLVRRKFTRELTDERRLAGSVRTNQCVDLAWTHNDFGMIGGDQSAKSLHQPHYLEQRYIAHDRPPRRNTLINPFGAASTTARSMAPRNNCQWIVKWLRISSSSRNTRAPRTPPHS